MILVADSGSSKTAWRGIAADGTIHQWEGQGINPLHLTDDRIQEIIAATFGEARPQVESIYFYGAGCVPGVASDRIKTILGAAFGTTDVHVADDMLAVARGVCGHAPGIACILGTGANSCVYDGKEISGKIPALGFILGDEGSGAWLGKELIGAYFRDELPEGIRARLEKNHNLERPEVLAAVYHGERPAAYLAGFSRFVFRHREDPWIYSLIYRGFDTFLVKNVCRYDNYLQIPVHFSGSIAFYYSTILRKVCADRGVTVKNIVEGPIAGLALFHGN